VYIIENQSVKISKKARPIDFKPKNIIDHRVFKINWRLKIKIAFSSLQEPVHNFFENGFQNFFSCLPGVMAIPQFFFQTKNKEIPIKKYKTIQAGAKSQFGGKKLGFLSWENQAEETAGAVKKEPIIPANWQTATETKNLIILLFIFSFYQNPAPEQISVRGKN